MKLAPSRPVRRLLAGLTPIVLVAAALPLLAPTCGTFTPGVKSFSRNSLIIPMDVCYQCTIAEDTGITPRSCGVTGYVTPTGPAYQGGIVCPQATDGGDVIRAYGLVYQLIRNGVAVYWVIDPAKAKLDAEDFRVSYSSGPPAFLYNWSTGGTGAAVTSGTYVAYRGGPFVVDGSDYEKASQVLQMYKATFTAEAPTATPPRYGVNVHVANVAFQAPVARTMAGGWSAGGPVPPKLALLDIGSMVGTSTARNSEPVIRGYLALAGLDTTGAGKTPSVDGTHGEIYDRLLIGDFIPTTAGDWKTSKLYQDGYQILWVPHWAAPGSCSNYSSTSNCTASQYSDADVAATVRTIGSFVTDTTLVGGVPAGKKDLFAECAGLGSFEGVPGNTAYSPTWFTPTQDYTHFHTAGVTPGVAITTTTPSGATYWGSFGNPLMQIGDFQFKPYSGAIATYKKVSDYKTPVVRLISEGTDNTKDVFSFIPAEASHGTVVYLGGHSYETGEGTYLTSGVRLVLNSLFNLGASCVETGITCSTGQLGVCSVGTMTCSGGEPVCTRVTGPSAEVCNGLDDDCNGLVDDLPVQTCYDGPAATKNVGLCSEGVRSCVELSPGVYGMSACLGQQLPVAEVCNALDDDCDGAVDETLTQPCYQGPPGTELVGVCKPGTQSCSGGVWTTCLGQVTPTAELCGDAGTPDGIDQNCNGVVDEGCGCTPGTKQPCYGGPTGTAGVGPCKAGEQTCQVDSTWGACTGQVVPVTEICGNTIDDDCNGFVDDDSVCKVCPTIPQTCYEGPDGTVDVGVCKAGQRTCALGVFGTCGGVVGTTVFTPQVLPSQEICDGLDNNCDGTVDEGPPACQTGSQCVNGYCVPDYCDPVEPFVIDGYTCDPATSKYKIDVCGTGTCDPATMCCTAGGCGAVPQGACLAGKQCLGGTCIDPCATVKCGAGATCGGGQCTGGSCYSAGCTGTLICKNGSCVTNPCSGIYCPSGTFCREGDCVQSCTFVTCLEGERCGFDGFCEPDPCAGVSCTSGKICSAGACVADPCEGLRCDTGQLCQDGACVDDPSAYITCPVGVPWGGQCYSSSNPFGEGTVDGGKDPGGCGCTSSTPNPAALLLGLLAIPLARRRRAVRPAGPGGSLLGLVLVTGLAATLAGCPEKAEESTAIDFNTDPANCGGLGNACLAGEICVDGFCGPGSAVAPYIQSLSPTSAAKGTLTPVTVTITGARFSAPMELKVTRQTGVVTTVPTTFVDAQHVTAQLDVSTDATGILYLRVRDADLVRSNSRPFDIILESPNVSAISPLTAQAGEVKTLHVTGTGLNATSQCIVGSTSFTDTALDTVVAAAGGLDCTLDTAGIPPGNYQIWVRNEGNLTSSKFTLVITSSTSMTLTSLSPSSGKGGVGALIPVTAYGTGFDATCVVYLQGNPPPAPAAAQDTTYISPTELFVAQMDLAPLSTAYPDGPHNVTVHCGAVTSAAVTFTISSSVPEVTLVSPQTAYQGETKVVSFTVNTQPTGTSLAAQIRRLDGTWVDFTSTARDTITPTTLVKGTMSFPAATWPGGEYQVRLRFEDGTLSASFPFRILSNTATLRSISPAGGMQGASIPSIAVTGTNFFAGITFDLRTSAGVVVTSIPVLGTPAMTSTTASIGPLSLTNRDTGLYQIVAANAGSGTSNALSFSITPGPPTIVGSPSPASAKQSSTPTPVTLTGTNFAKPDASGNGGSQVVAWNTGLGITAPIVLPSASVQVVDYDTIIVTLDTLSVVASATNPYTIQVWNPGGATPPQKSNTTTFTVTP